MSQGEVDTGQENTHQGGLGAVGSRLANARKKMQLSVEALAAELHLSQDIILALEAGDESKLPAAAFVRGYVKNYARRVGLDESEMLALMPVFHEHRVTPLKRVGIRRRRISLIPGKWVFWLTGLSALVVLVLYGVPALERLWTAQPEEDVSNQLALPGRAPEKALVPAEPAEIQEAPEPIEEPVREPLVAESIEPEPASAPSPLPEAPPSEPESRGPATVKLRFLEDSWVEMEANGRKLVVGTQRAGSERTVTADPPIRLLLGNAPGVELSYRGKPVDLGARSRGKVANLTLED